MKQKFYQIAEWIGVVIFVLVLWAVLMLAIFGGEELSKILN